MGFPLAKKKKVLKVRRRPRPAPEKFSKALNDEQLKVVIHDAGPALVIAGAGSGKTRALTYRVAWLIDGHAPPEAIMLVTFTKKAAEEMTHRAELLSGGAAKHLLAGTFHHVANLFLRKYAKTLDAGYTSNYTIIDTGDQTEVMKLAVAQLVPKADRKRYPKAAVLQRLYSKALNLETEVEILVDAEYPSFHDEIPVIKRILQRYHDLKREMNVMDYDDLLVNFLALLRNSPAASKIRKRVRHVLVDEYQDVNAIQADIVDEISRDVKSLTVVGDDAQAIYAFRGADFEHMLHFPDRHADTTIYKLEQNYRSTPEILALANASIAHNQHQFAKVLHTTRESGELPYLVPCVDQRQEADFICSQVLLHRDDGIPLCEQAALFRAGHHRFELERALLHYNIPYEVRAGVRFFEKAHIKDALAHLVVMVNPHERIQWMRILTRLEGIGDTAATKILDLFVEETIPLEAFLATDPVQDLKGKRVRRNGKDSLRELQGLFQSILCEAPGKPVRSSEDWPALPDLLTAIVDFVTPGVKKKYDDAEGRVQELGELVNYATRYSDVNEFLGDILMKMTISGETIVEGAEVEEEKPFVLSTVHQAKGLEWSVVYVMSLIEGNFPISQAIGNPDQVEEERRLFYVAATRAKDYLYLTYPELYRGFGGDTVKGPSSLVEEIRDQEVFDEVELEVED